MRAMTDLWQPGDPALLRMRGDTLGTTAFGYEACALADSVWSAIACECASHDR